jgi:hypothetical protein
MVFTFDLYVLVKVSFMSISYPKSTSKLKVNLPLVRSNMPLNVPEKEGTYTHTLNFGTRWN